MKTKLHKALLFLLVTMLAFQVQGQTYGEYTIAGTYKINVPGEDYFMTVNSSGGLEWAAELPGNDPKQLWTIQDHVMPADVGFVQITATVPGLGNFTMGTIPANVSGKNITLTVKAGDPISDVNDPLYYYDQFQRRKTATSNGGNDALFIKVPGEAGSRYGVAPTAVGDLVKFDGGGIDKLEFQLISGLSTETFDLGSFFMSNPVNNQLTIQGLPSNVKQITVYSLLGQKLLSKDSSGDSSLSLDVSGLKTGVYVVDFSGENGRFTKKIIKQ
ncbi:T9SS C-terminal target domain-containing protein [Lutibacter sp. HS1-25]|uniref:T9SS type A sorting domain-containing protein n=1 Tax=Lutibacter sp. HS1-25 TaxID=2485000 RepID=UPI0010115F22|nr:T9SS type A sorting domain-containing protein [Lutibacter sp. HS1-25]RXP62751.1 T9SS C-terminal target domain-containing protein [Lutibacter sp. HS1-25]